MPSPAALLTRRFSAQIALSSIVRKNAPFDIMQHWNHTSERLGLCANSKVPGEHLLKSEEGLWSPGGDRHHSGGELIGKAQLEKNRKGYHSGFSCRRSADIMQKTGWALGNTCSTKIGCKPTREKCLLGRTGVFCRWKTSVIRLYKTWSQTQGQQASHDHDDKRTQKEMV